MTKQELLNMRQVNKEWKEIAELVLEKYLTVEPIKIKDTDTCYSYNYCAFCTNYMEYMNLARNFDHLKFFIPSCKNHSKRALENIFRYTRENGYIAISESEFPFQEGQKFITSHGEYFTCISQKYRKYFNVRKKKNKWTIILKNGNKFNCFTFNELKKMNPIYREQFEELEKESEKTLLKAEKLSDLIIGF